MSVFSNQLKQFKETKQGESMSEVPSQHTRDDVMRSVLTNNQSYPSSGDDDYDYDTSIAVCNILSCPSNSEKKKGKKDSDSSKVSNSAIMKIFPVTSQSTRTDTTPHLRSDHCGSTSDTGGVIFTCMPVRFKIQACEYLDSNLSLIHI